MTKRDLRLWHGNYPRRRNTLVAKAYANPDTRCWRCGHPLHHPTHQHRDGTPSKWTAGHTIDSDPRSPLAPEASRCNYSAGGKLSRFLAKRREPRSPNG